MLDNNLLAFIVTLALSISWLRFVGYAVLKGWISNTISRKVIHIGTGPLFVLCWLLFDNSGEARYLAAVVPLISTIQFGLAGAGRIKDKASVASMSRSGVREELLKGPFFYGIVFVLITLIFWKSSPAGIVALMALCGGDGLADIFGQKYGKSVLPWSKKKTWAGSLAMFLGGLFLSGVILWIFTSLGEFQLELTRTFLKLIIVALVTTLVESVSRSDVDNFTVPLSAVLLWLIM